MFSSHGRSESSERSGEEGETEGRGLTRPAGDIDLLERGARLLLVSCYRSSDVRIRPPWIS